MTIPDGQSADCFAAVKPVFDPAEQSVIMYQIKGAGPSYGISMSAAILMSVLPIVAFLLMQRADDPGDHDRFR